MHSSIKHPWCRYIYCQGHAGAHGNEMADSLDSRVPNIGMLKMGREEIMREVDSFLRDDSVVVEASRLGLHAWGIDSQVSQMGTALENG